MALQKSTPKIDRLIARLKNATRERGLKSLLAQQLEVPRQRLNGWLSGANVPGGEVALQMLEWVTAREAKSKQTKRAGSALTPPTLKTRKSKSTQNEKAKSGPFKKR